MVVPHISKNYNKKGSKNMAKKYPFTRTISKQNVAALIFDKTTAEPSNVYVTIAPPISDPKALDRAVQKKVETDNIKFIEISDVSIDEKVYGITLDDFMSIAVELDPKTRKPINA